MDHFLLSFHTDWIHFLLFAILFLSQLAYVLPNSGFCQIFSYNIESPSHLLLGINDGHILEKHLFVCCDNHGEHSCTGHTYQKPSSDHEFCTGAALGTQESRLGDRHWTQKEVIPALPGGGNIYCGDCCGQQMAAQACNKKFGENNLQCNNWVQCFMNECLIIIQKVAANKDLGCELPPPPHPKHFHQDPRTLPPNASSLLRTTPHPLSNSSFTPDTCTEHTCNQLSLHDRCQLGCCAPYCCLPDGVIRSDHPPVFLGLSAGTLAGVIIGLLLLLLTLTVILVIVTKRCRERCKLMRVPQKDTQILVIEAQEEVDSDIGDSS